MTYLIVKKQLNCSIVLVKLAVPENKFEIQAVKIYLRNFDVLVLCNLFIFGQLEKFMNSLGYKTYTILFEYFFSY